MPAKRYGTLEIYVGATAMARSVLLTSTAGLAIRHCAGDGDGGVGTAVKARISRRPIRSPIRASCSKIKAE